MHVASAGTAGERFLTLAECSDSHTACPNTVIAEADHVGPLGEAQTTSISRYYYYKGGNWKCGGRGDEGSGAVEGASRVIYGRDLFSSG